MPTSYLAALPLPMLLLASSMVAGTSAAQDVLIFKTKSIGPYDQAIEGFHAECKHRSTVFDMDGDDRKGLAMVEQIRATRPKVVLAIGTKAARLSKEKLPDIPVIFCMVLNPDKSGVLGPNTTGVLLQIPYSRQFTHIKTLLPTLKRVGVLFNPATTEDDVDLATEEGVAVGIELLPAVVTSAREVPGALNILLANKIDLLWLTTDPTVLNRDTLTSAMDAAREKHVPVIAFASSFLGEGALVPLAPSYTGMGKQAGRMASKILGGAKVSDLAVEPPQDTYLFLTPNRGATRPVQGFGIDVDAPPYTPLYQLP